MPAARTPLGISLLGRIAGGLALGLPVIRRAGVRLWPVLDGVAPGVVLGIAIGRVGGLVVADHLAILALLLTIWSRRRTYDGSLALLFGTLYGTARLVEDFFRVDETHGTRLAGSQWTALTVAALATWWLAARRRTPGRKQPAPERVPSQSNQGAAP